MNKNDETRYVRATLSLTPRQHRQAAFGLRKLGLDTYRRGFSAFVLGIELDVHWGYIHEATAVAFDPLDDMPS